MNNSAYYTMDQLAERWHCSRTSVYRCLRDARAQILDFASPGKRGKKLVPINTVFQIETAKTKKLM